jgi:hypothetical protein
MHAVTDRCMRHADCTHHGGGGGGGPSDRHNQQSTQQPHHCQQLQLDNTWFWDNKDTYCRPASQASAEPLHANHTGRVCCDIYNSDCVCPTVPAALSSLFFCSAARRLASSSCFSRALRFAFLPLQQHKQAHQERAYKQHTQYFPCYTVRAVCLHCHVFSLCTTCLQMRRPACLIHCHLTHHTLCIHTPALC